MNAEADKGVGQAVESASGIACGGQLQREFQHLKGQWWWLRVFGILLVICGAAAVISPA